MGEGMVWAELGDKERRMDVIKGYVEVKDYVKR